MQVLARLMDRALDRRGTALTIVGATSGDTGAAAIEAFRGARAPSTCSSSIRTGASARCSGAR